MMIRKERYKGFNIEYTKVPRGFNTWTIYITKYRFTETRREEFFSHRMDTYSLYIKDARKMAKKYIDKIKTIRWRSQGLMKAEYLPP